LVLLLNRSGNSSAKSGDARAQQLGWISATPLVLCVPTMARCAMRTCRAFADQADAPHPLGVARVAPAHLVEEAAIDLVETSSWRGSRISNSATGQLQCPGNRV
jgi:hypothetical protein